VIDDRDADALDDANIVIACEPVLVPARDAACMCGISERGWRKLDRCGLVPRAVAIGRRRLWPVALLRRWAELGCPGRSDFEMRAGVENPR
jgi:hypothetical protein